MRKRGFVRAAPPVPPMEPLPDPAEQVVMSAAVAAPARIAQK